MSFCVSLSSWGKSLEGVSFADHLNFAGKKLTLNGLGLREASVFKVDVYVIGLYVEKTSQKASDHLNSTGPKLIKMHFVRDLEASKLREAWITAFSNNSRHYNKLKPRVLQLNSAMVDVKVGDEISYKLYGSKTEILVNGKVKTTIRGEDFARELLNVWLGDNPPNEGLKEGLLGKS